MNKQEYIDTAQALGKIPGAERFPWALYEEDAMREEAGSVVYSGNFFTKVPVYDIRIGPWLRIDDFNEWGAPKFLERAGARMGSGHIYLPFAKGKRYLVAFDDGFHLPTELDYNKAILNIGQNAHDETKTEEDRKPWLEAWQRGMNVND